MHARAGTADAQRHVAAHAAASAWRAANVASLSDGRGGKGKALGPGHAIAWAAGINTATLGDGRRPHGRRHLAAKPTEGAAARATTSGATRDGLAAAKPLTDIE